MWNDVIKSSRVYYNWDLLNNEVRRESRGFMIFENSEMNEVNKDSMFEGN